MSEEQRKPGNFKASHPGLLAKQLLQASRLKPGDVVSTESERQAAATSVEEALSVQEPVSEPEPVQPATRQTMAETKAKRPPASNVVVNPPSATIPRATDTGPRKMKPSQRPGPDTIIRKRNASLAEGRQVAVRLPLATTQQIDAICESIKQVSGFKDPLLDAEFARVAIEFLLRVLRARNIDLAQAYADIDTRYSLRLGETRVETVLLQYLADELPDLLRDE